MKYIFLGLVLICTISCGTSRKERLEKQAMAIFNKRLQWLDSANRRYYANDPKLYIDSLRFIKLDSSNALFLVYSHHGEKSRQDTARFEVDNNGNLIKD